MRTSGLVLDIYDDFQGQTLRSLYPSFSDIPEQVKTARALGSEDRAALPDDVFALVLENDGQKIRKYACVDEGNTTLSVQFFLKNAHKLPVEARIRGAENLKVACAWYNIAPPPELEKIALGAAPILAGIASIPILAGTAHEMAGRHAAVGALGGRDGTIITPQQRDSYRAEMMKGAEINASVDNPISAPSKGPVVSQTVVKKTADIGHLVKDRRSQGEDFGPEESNRYDGYTKGENIPALKQMRAMHPHVDVTNKEPPKVVVEKKASIFALPGRYPLDNYAQVKEASAYFDQYSRMFAPEERREYCVQMVKRASALGIPVSEVARKYAAEDYAPEEEIKVGHALRREALGGNKDAIALLDNIYEKRASFDASTFCSVLEEFDKVVHLDFAYNRGVPDPYYSTFGEKTAETTWSEILGNDLVTEEDLRRLSKIGVRALKSTFSEDFAQEFRKDPVGIFKSLPRDQKKLIMRMAVDNSGPGIELTA